MVRVKRLGVISVANIQGLFGVVLGLIFGIFYGLLFTLIGLGGVGEGGGILAGIGLLVIIVAPVFYGVVSWVSGALISLIYNLLAGWTGGIEMNLVEK